MNFDDMSRDQLIQVAKSQEAGLLRLQNTPATAFCPFCLQTGIVPWIKCAVKGSLLSEWNKPVTQEEWDAYVLATYGPAKT